MRILIWQCLIFPILQKFQNPSIRTRHLKVMLQTVYESLSNFLFLTQSLLQFIFQNPSRKSVGCQLSRICKARFRSGCGEDVWRSEEWQAWNYGLIQEERAQKTRKVTCIYLLYRGGERATRRFPDIFGRLSASSRYPSCRCFRLANFSRLPSVGHVYPPGLRALEPSSFVYRPRRRLLRT